ncbi:hypothetical protein F5144DRAFT_21155 [Chaetomium tenue]|uniref:Uncharacterized protein n=1 Tax=Chaetomium tenue TaxID=1854479 RepID=A0ACB7PND9_9PEZI|nr:hypothetical protein F5144DRAFT_21155 [Chaetomium globosum]
MIPGVSKQGGTPGNWKGWGLVVFFFSLLESGRCYFFVLFSDFSFIGHVGAFCFSHFYFLCLDVGCANACNVGWSHPSLCLIPALVAATTTVTPGWKAGRSSTRSAPGNRLALSLISFPC